MKLIEEDIEPGILEDLFRVNRNNDALFELMAKLHFLAVVRYGFGRVEFQPALPTKGDWVEEWMALPPSWFQLSKAELKKRLEASKRKVMEGLEAEKSELELKVYFLIEFINERNHFEYGKGESAWKLDRRRCQRDEVELRLTEWLVRARGEVRRYFEDRDKKKWGAGGLKRSRFGRPEL